MINILKNKYVRYVSSLSIAYLLSNPLISHGRAAIEEKFALGQVNGSAAVFQFQQTTLTYLHVLLVLSIATTFYKVLGYVTNKK